jgi:hypothetical protein
MNKFIYPTDFTPGPWVKLNGSNVFTKLGAINSEGISAPSDDGWMIADTDAGSLGFKELQANTLLISKAPQLYQKLDQLLCIVGLTAFKHESQREFLQKACDEAHEILKEAAGFKD